MRTTDWEPVSDLGRRLAGRRGVATRYWGLVPRTCVGESLTYETDDAMRRKLPRDRALRGGVHELGVLRENATGIARGKRRPAFTAGGQLGLVDK